MKKIQQNLGGVEGPFEKFLNLIGDPIKLQGWKKYRAGLDVVDNIHGTTAYYAEWKNHHIMFHVANLIPFTEGDPQQVNFFFFPFIYSQ